MMMRPAEDAGLLLKTVNGGKALLRGWSRQHHVIELLSIS
jgi:hypothetical protein